MRALFLGTPAAAVPSLAALADVADVELVVTRPDRPRGRSGRPAPPAVKLAAVEFGFPVAQPGSVDELRRVLDETSADVALVVAYGRILPPDVIAAVPRGFLNVHFSLLPRWRGAAPVERAILEGDAETGVTLMIIDEGLDTGPVVSAIETPIGADETGGSLTARLSYLGAKLVDDVFPDYLAGKRRAAAQLAAGVTVARPLTRDEARLDATWSAARAERAVRAFHPRPGAWIETPEGVVKIRAVAPVDADVPPGEIQPIAGIPCAGFEGGALELVEVQPAGKRPIGGRAWMHGRRGRGTTMLASTT